PSEDLSAVLHEAGRRNRPRADRRATSDPRAQRQIVGRQHRGCGQRVSRRAAGCGEHSMKRVLVVEDEQRMRRVLQILIEKIGLESSAAEGGEQALALFRSEQIDLVLSDLKMAPMDGLTLLRELRAIDPEVPVIILTAFGTISTAIEAMKLGAFDFVLKPFDRTALEIVVRKALDVSRYQL